LEKQLDTLVQHLPSIYFQLPFVPNPSSPATTEPLTSYPETHSTHANLDETTILCNTSLLIRTSATIYFHATLRSLNPHSARARALIEQIIGYTRHLSPNNLRSAHLWPLFVGAVYSTGNDEERVWFLNQFDVLGKEQRALVARGALRRVREIVESVWKRRDLDDEHEHDSQQRRVGVAEIGDWEKYVQPLSEGLCLG
jgi:Fungal specific transcription factor domain